MLERQHLAEQHARGAHQRTAGLEQDLAVAVTTRIDARQQRHHQHIGRGRRLVGVGDAQPAADVDVMNRRDAIGFDRLHQVEQAIERVEVRAGVGDLRADVAVDADNLEARQACRAPVHRERLVVRNAELVALQPGGDVGVRAGVDVGIHAQAHARRALRRGGDLGQQLEFGFALDVEAAHAHLQRTLHFGARLAVSALAALVIEEGSSSPPETMSKPQPARAKVCNTARLELAFIA